MIGDALTVEIILAFMLKRKGPASAVFSSENELTKLKKMIWSSLMVCY